MIDLYHKWSRSFRSPIIGFFLSVLLTLVAYFIIVQHWFNGWMLTIVILGLGGIQALIQLVFFLHLGIEDKPRWNLLMFLFMVLITVVVIGGSLWIMYNLNYNMMPTMKH